ncbi:MAG: HPF/RaiA family ribosome-associated protein [Myxococcaceae bacterium]
MDDATIHITWHGLDASEALEQRIRDEVDRLRSIYPRSTACRVVIEQPHRRHRQGSHFVVKVELTVPGKTLVVTRDPTEHRENDDAFVACGEAFDTMRRQLEEYVRQLREPGSREGRFAKRAAT